MTPFAFVVLALAVYRATRLVTADKITEPFRVAVDSRSKWAGYLVTCDWCLSVWLAPWFTAVMIRWPESRAVWAVCGFLAVSAVVGLLSVVEGRLDR